MLSIGRQIGRAIHDANPAAGTLGARGGFSVVALMQIHGQRRPNNLALAKRVRLGPQGQIVKQGVWNFDRDGFHATDCVT